jgi:3-hydroxyisobutyrate dehydrogenase
MKLGFVGLGTMGNPMVRNLITAGFNVKVYDSVEAALNKAAGYGAIRAESCFDAAHDSDVTITMLPDTPDVQSVVMGKEGVLTAMHPGGIVIDMSTISPVVTQEFSKEAVKAGVIFLDAPVSGGEPGAIAATLSIMVGGEESAFQKCLGIFNVLGKNINYMGPSGSGQTTKLCNQIICGLNIQAMCEGLILGAKAGLNMEKLLSVVSAGAAGSWMLTNLGPKIITKDYKPGFKIKLQQKDLRLALDQAFHLKVPLPGTGIVHQVLRVAENAGMSEQGTQAAITALEKMCGFEVH